MPWVDPSFPQNIPSSPLFEKRKIDFTAVEEFIFLWILSFYSFGIFKSKHRGEEKKKKEAFELKRLREAMERERE